MLNPNNRNSFNLERGDTIKLPAGSIAYLANRDDNQDLRVLDLAIPVNRPGQFQVIWRCYFFSYVLCIHIIVLNCGMQHRLEVCTTHHNREIDTALVSFSPILS